MQIFSILVVLTSVISVTGIPVPHFAGHLLSLSSTGIVPRNPAIVIQNREEISDVLTKRYPAVFEVREARFKVHTSGTKPPSLGTPEPKKETFGEKIKTGFKNWMPWGKSDIDKFPNGSSRGSKGSDSGSDSEEG